MMNMVDRLLQERAAAKIAANQIIRDRINGVPWYNQMAAVTDVISELAEKDYDGNARLIEELLYFKYDLSETFAGV